MLVCIVTTARCRQAPPNADDRLADLLAAYESWGFSGSVLVAHGPEIVHEEGYGYANRATGEQNTAATRFDFASLAKTFTGAATLRLEADGHLQVADRLAVHLGPFADTRKAPATVHHLATHMGGLAHRSTTSLAYGLDRAAYVESMKNAPFESPPGERYRYSNAGSSLLAAVVETVAGVPYQRYVQTQFFAPLALNTMQFVDEIPPGTPGVALGYQDETDTPAPEPYTDGFTWGAIGATGIVATPRDLYAWFQALYRGDVLPPEQRRKMFDETEEEAYGWHTERDEAGRLRIHKGGGLQAMQSQLIAFPEVRSEVRSEEGPEEGVAFVWAHNNMTQNWRRALNQGLTHLVLGEPFGPVPAVDAAYQPGDRPLPPAGVYAAEEGVRMELHIENGRPMLGRNGLGLNNGPLKPGPHPTWATFDPEAVAWLQLSVASETTLSATLGPEGRSLVFTRTQDPPATLLDAPDPALVAQARGYAEALQTGAAEALWQASLYRPILGTNSEADWARRVGFFSRMMGTETTLVEESWVLRDGSWRYWRVIEGATGAQALLRFQLTQTGQIAAFGFGPAAQAPPSEDRQPIR